MLDGHIVLILNTKYVQYIKSNYQIQILWKII